MNYVLLFQIISAQQLPKINTEKASSIVDPLVWVEIHGVAIDKAKQKTHRIDNNGNIYLFIHNNKILKIHFYMFFFFLQSDNIYVIYVYLNSMQAFL